VPDIAAANLLQGAEYFNIALVTCSTLDNVLVFLTLALGAEMLQTGFALQDKEKRSQYAKCILVRRNTKSLFDPITTPFVYNRTATSLH